jgi:acyl carrier protein
MDTKEQIADISTFIIGKLAEFAGVPDLGLHITASSNLQESGMDSIGMVWLIIELEQQYSISFEDEEMLEENFKTIELISMKIIEKLTTRY